MFQDIGDAIRQIQRTYGPGPAALLHQLIGSWKALGRSTSYNSAIGRVFSTTYTKQALAARLGRKKRDTVDSYAKTLERIGVLRRGDRAKVHGLLDRGVLFIIELGKLLAMVSPFQRQRAARKVAARSTVPKKRVPLGQDSRILENKPSPCPHATEYAEAMERGGIASHKGQGFKTRFATMAKRHGYTVDGVAACARALAQNPPRRVVSSLAAVLYYRLDGDTFGRAWYDSIMAEAKQKAEKLAQIRLEREKQAAMAAANDSKVQSAWGDLVQWWNGLTQEARNEWTNMAARRWRFLPLTDENAILGAIANLRGGLA